MTDYSSQPDDPTSNTAVQEHPAVTEMRRLQAQWKRTLIQDPRIQGYQMALDKAQKAGLDPVSAVLFAAKAATGK